MTLADRFVSKRAWARSSRSEACCVKWDRAKLDSCLVRGVLIVVVVVDSPVVVIAVVVVYAAAAAA